jgi:hypothetical protein
MSRATEGAEHPREVAWRDDRGTEAAPNRLARRGAAEVVVAACALRVGDDLHLAMVAAEFDDRLALEVGCLERRLAPATSVVRRPREPETQTGALHATVGQRPRPRGSFQARDLAKRRPVSSKPSRR